jgi:hypothetical protein
VALDATRSLGPSDFKKLLKDPDETIRNHALHLLTNRKTSDLRPYSTILLDLAKTILPPDSALPLQELVNIVSTRRFASQSFWPWQIVSKIFTIVLFQK